jgi:hypothetical protein
VITAECLDTIYMSFDFTGLRVATEKIVLRFNESGWTHFVSRRLPRDCHC